MYYNNRWNPTKEQIDMLEGFYKGGITCPSTAEIHHMAGKLRVYGNVESKNVFYWFQNHKARKRQRQVRHAYGYDPRLHYNHQQLLHQQIPSPMGLAPNPSAPCTNGPSLCPPYAQQYQNPKLVLLPLKSTVLASSAAGNIVNLNKRPAGSYPQEAEYFNHKQKQTKEYSTSSSASSVHQTFDNAAADANNHHDTLPLFPVHPTGILKWKRNEKYFAGFYSSSSKTISFSTAGSSTNHQEDSDANAAKNGNGRQFFDFFATQ